MEKEVVICRRCGLPRLPTCKDGVTVAGPGAYTRCDNDRKIEIESIPLRGKHGFLTWRQCHGVAKSWKGRWYYVFYIGDDSNNFVIVRPKKGGENLLLKKKSFFETIEAEKE